MKDVRDHLTESISRDRLALEARRGARPALVILAAVVVTALCGAWVVSNVSQTFLKSTRTLRFEVGDATSIVPGRHEVRFKGIPAGTITKVDLAGDRAVVTVKLQKKWGKVYRDARASIRPVTPLEDMYLDITDRGTPSAGEANRDTPIDSGRTETSVDIADVLNAFGPTVRGRLRALLTNLGGGLADRGASLQAAFARTVPVVEAAGEASRQLAIRAERTKALVHNTGVLTRELATRDLQVRRLLVGGASTFTTLQNRRADLDATLRELPPTLSALDSGLTTVGAVLPAVDDAARNLTRTADALPGGLKAISSLSDEASPALRALQPAVRRLLPLSRALVPSAADLSYAVSTLRPQVPVFNRTVKNLANCERGISDFFTLDPAFGTLSDSRGPLLRADVVEGTDAAGVTNDSRYFYNKACTPGAVLGGRPATAKDGH